MSLGSVPNEQLLWGVQTFQTMMQRNEGIVIMNGKESRVFVDIAVIQRFTSDNKVFKGVAG